MKKNVLHWKPSTWWPLEAVTEPGWPPACTRPRTASIPYVLRTKETDALGFEKWHWVCPWGLSCPWSLWACDSCSAAERSQRASFTQMCTERLLRARASSRHYRLADFFLTLAWNQHDYHLSFSLQNRQVTSDDELGYPGSNVPAVPSCLCPSELRWSSRRAQHTSEIPHGAWNHLPYWFLAIKYHWRPAPLDLLLGVLQGENRTVRPCWVVSSCCV